MDENVLMIFFTFAFLIWICPKWIKALFMVLAHVLLYSLSTFCWGEPSGTEGWWDLGGWVSAVDEWQSNRLYNIEHSNYSVLILSSRFWYSTPEDSSTRRNFV